MLKKLALLLILLFPTIAAQAFTVSMGAVTNVTSLLGNCGIGDSIGVHITGTLSTTVDDPGDFAFDWFTFVLYDGYGTALNTYSGAYLVGTTLPIGTLNISPSVTPQARPFTVSFYDTNGMKTTAAQAQRFPLLASLTFDPVDFGTCANLPYYTPPADDGGAPQFRDGRLNRFDMAAPFVVFGHEFEDGSGLVVYSPEGALLLTVGPDEIAVECTGETIELASDNGVTLYLLPSCEYQMMARSLDGTKNYVLIFSELSANANYRSYEE